METVSNTVSSIANVASKAIWGDSTTEAKKDETAVEEPLSGETGDVKSGEPYDKGNLDSTDTEMTKPATESESESTSVPSTTDTTTMPIHSEHETSKSDEPSKLDEISKPDETSAPSLAASGKPTSVKDTSGADPSPSGGAPPLTARPAEEHEKGQQGADKSLEERKSSGAKKEEVVGGISSVGGGEEQPKKSVGEGVGENTGKSVGGKADGGDLNAANVGAGKEADRILEQKGIHHDTPADTKTSTPSSSKSDLKADSHTKVSLKDKLKAKLHRHKDSKE